ncbi:MAG: TonB-dependent receptor [Bacteroidota bacterium]
MNYFKILLVGCLFLTVRLNAQTNNTIKGIVIDKQTRLPVAGATVLISTVNPAKATRTDENGIYKLTSLPVGRHNLEVTFVGYTKAITSQVLLSSGKDLEINFEIEENLNNLGEVVVSSGKNKRPLNQLAGASARSFSVEETSRYAAALFDPARMAQSFAGVVASEDDNNIVIRGNAPKSVLWRLEGVEIINPNHFGEEGSSGGGISMINANVLGSSDFYTGGTPAEFGNSIAGAFDLQFRKGNTDKREYSFTLGVLGAAVSMEGPFKKGSPSSYLLSYRYSSFALMDKIGVSVSDVGTPLYQDLSYNFVFPTPKAGTFSIFGIGGNSNVEDVAVRDASKWENKFDYADQKYSYSAASTGLKHTVILNNKLNLKNVLAFSGSENTDRVDTLTRDYDANVFSRNAYKNWSLRYSGQVNYSPGANNLIRSGITASLLNYNLKGLEYNNELKGLNEVLNNSGSTSSIDLYSQWKHTFSEKLNFNAGIHANYFEYSKSLYVEPRAGVNWWVNSNQQISLSAGLYSRVEPMAFYFVNDQLTESDFYTAKKLKPTRSAELILAYERGMGKGLKFKAETYYQHLFEVPISNNPASNFSTLNVSGIGSVFASGFNPLINKGTGKNLGLELTLEKSLLRGNYFLFTTSVFDSKYKNAEGKELNTAFNTRFMANFVSGKEWQTGRDQKNVFGVNAKVIYTGGRKYTPILLPESIAKGEQVNDDARTNMLTADAYMRLDFSTSYRVNRNKVSHTFFLDIQNLTNRINNLGYYYNSDDKSLDKSNLSGIIPVVNYRLEF